jgi:hypothetical protein
VPFVVGIILTPVGAFVATLAFEIGVSATHSALGSWLVSADMLMVFAVVWLTYALAYTAPVTLIVLPLVYAALRRRSALTRTRIIVAGVSAAIVLMWAYIGVSEFLSEKHQFKPSKIAGFTLIGLLTGLVVGAAFAYIMRWKRPVDWSPGSGAAEELPVT